MREEQKGLIAAYRVDAQGGAQELDWEQLELVPEPEQYVWLHFNYSDPTACDWLKTRSGIDPIIVETLLSDETRPRMVVERDGLLLTLRGVNHNPGSDPEDMVSIRLWIQGHRVISTRRRKLLSIRDIRESLEQGRGPATVGQFVAFLTEKLSERVSTVVEATEEHVDDIEEQMLALGSYQLRSELSDLRREIIALRRYLAPQREALSRLSQESASWISNQDRMHFRESTDKTMRYIEELDAIRDRAMVCQEELVSRLSEQMNQRMYVLSMITAIFLPLGFLTGLLGVNVGGIPGAESEAGFWIFLSMLLALLMGQYWFFRRKHWM